MKKTIITLVGLIIVLLPLKLEALTGNVNLNCSSETIKPGEYTNCTISGNTDEEISALAIKLTLGDNLALSEIETDSSWQGDGEEGDIQLFTDKNKKGDFPIATFKVKASSSAQPTNTNIVLKEIKLTDSNFKETSLENVKLDVRIPSIVNTLNNLTIDGTSISGFSSNKSDYELTLDSNKTRVNIGAIATDSNSKIEGDLGVKKLKYGINLFNVRVIAETGESKVYKIKINRPEIRELKTLIINGENIELKNGIYEYKYIVKNDITSIDLKAEINNKDEVQFIDGYGERIVEQLKVGYNDILIKIKDKNNEELIYTLKINRLNEENRDITIEENPKTLKKSNYNILIFVIFVAIVIYVFIRKKTKFQKNI